MNTIANDRDRASYLELVETTLRVLDRLAVVRPDAATMSRCSAEMSRTIEALGRLSELPENLDAPAHAPGSTRFQPAERGLTPTFHIEIEDDLRITGKVSFSLRFGGTGSVHGGALALFFDDALGRVANKALVEEVARTAFLHIDYRSLAPLEVQLDCRAWIARVEGRKRVMRGELRHHGQVVAEAHGLWVAPRSS